MERTIKVTGKGNLRIKPDTVRMMISQTGITKDYAKTLELSARSKNMLNEKLVELGFHQDDLKTMLFSVDVDYESYKCGDEWSRRFNGYAFNHRLKLELPVGDERLGKVMYVLAHCPGETEFGLMYTVKDPEKYKNELLADAIRDSSEKARVLTRTAGVDLGEIQSIDYSWGEIEFVNRPVGMPRLDCCKSSTVNEQYDLDIEPDDIEASDTVTVLWEIR